MADQTKKTNSAPSSKKLYDAVAAWAEDDFRSVNGQIEYLLTECVRQRKKNGAYTPKEFDVLIFFMQHKDVAISRERLLSAVWGFEYGGGEPDD